MYPVSNDYKNRINQDCREFEVKVIIDHEEGSLEIGDEEISLGGLTYKSATQSGDDFTIGGIVASDLSLNIRALSGEFDEINFEGAIIRPSIGLKLPNETFEYVPLGTFIVDEDKRSIDIITLKAMDYMLKLGDDYSNSTLTYPATLLQIVENICSQNNIPLITTNFPNRNYLVQDKPEGDYSFRDILGFVAELSGTFAKINRLGQMELRWYSGDMVEISPEVRYSSKISDEEMSITGISYTVEGDEDNEDVVYITGTEDYLVDISENPLLQSDYETILPNILNNVENVVFRPFESEWFGNPAIDSGDKVELETVSGEFINSIVTKTTYKYGGKSKLEGSGTPKVKRGYEGTTSKRINQIVRKIRQQDRDYNEKLSDLELAQANAMELMANMLGGHLIVDEVNGAIYIANNPDLNQATEYWEWSSGGFVHWKDGVIDTGITADGSIVAYLVNAGIVTADMVKTGILQSQDGHTWINLNNGHFNLGNIKFDQNGFRIVVHDRTLEDTLDDKINRGDLSVSAENRLYQSKTQIPLRFNEGYSGELQLFRNAFHPYYRVTSSGNGMNLFGNFPNSQYAEDLTGEEVTISLDISADENGTIEIDGEEFTLVENKWTRVYITKIFPSTNTKNIRVRTLYSKGHSRDIVYGNNLIDYLITDLNLIYYRNLQVQKGKIPTVHTLTPEEIEEYNERNKSEIKQLVDSISMMVRKDELSAEFMINAESIVQAINTTDGVGKVKTVNAILDEHGLTIENGALIIRDSNNVAIVTSNGLRLKYLYDSVGSNEGVGFGTWGWCGIIYSSDGLMRPTSMIFVDVPEKFIIESANLKIRSMPVYMIDGNISGAPEGLYHPRGLGLYLLSNTNISVTPNQGYYGGFLDLEEQSNITSATLGSVWNPSGSQVVETNVDISDYLTSGEITTLGMRSNQTMNQSNSRYNGLISMQVELTGFLRG